MNSKTHALFIMFLINTQNTLAHFFRFYTLIYYDDGPTCNWKFQNQLGILLSKTQRTDAFFLKLKSNDTDKCVLTEHWRPATRPVSVVSFHETCVALRRQSWNRRWSFPWTARSRQRAGILRRCLARSWALTVSVSQPRGRCCGGWIESLNLEMNLKCISIYTD